MTEPVLVAPRELYDFVYRIARVDGFDPAAASVFGDAVVAATVAGHDGSSMICELIDTNAICDVLLARDALAAGEVEARAAGAATVSFELGVPEPMLLSTLQAMAERGVTRNGSSQVDGLVTGVMLEADDPAPASPSSDALAVARHVFDELQRRSERFLVSEATLDALVDDES